MKTLKKKRHDTKKKKENSGNELKVVMHKTLPVVVIEAIDHCMDVPRSLREDNMKFHVTGILFAETKDAWYLASWLFMKDINDANNEGFMIVKTPGAKITVLGHVNNE